MKKFKTLQEELDFWASKTLEERKAIMAKQIVKTNERRLKSTMANFETYLRSGYRTY